MILKLDMAKAYDRIQWRVLYTVMEKMGFSAQWINMIARCIEHCHFSVIINGEPSGFFKSSNGLRQGDPLSPTLFIIAVEILSKGLKQLFDRNPGMIYDTKCGFGISHLAYADDVIIFTRDHKKGIRTLMQFLKEYEMVSG